jgi:hypothetical protein
MAEGEIILYRADDGSAHVQRTEMDGSVWMNQAEIAELYQTSKQAISHHIRNVLSEGELTEAATVKESLTVQSEGKRRVSRSIKIDRLAMFLDFTKDRVSQRKHLTLEDWRTTMDRFIAFNERPLLNNAGRTSHERMKRITHDRYETAAKAAKREAGR